jgi:predicted TIM-barrel enzyme
MDAASTVRKDIVFLCHGGPINTPDDAARVIYATGCQGFVGASSLERMAVESSLAELTRRFKGIPGSHSRAISRQAFPAPQPLP